MSDQAAVDKDHTPSDFGGHIRNPDGTIKDWKYVETDPPSREDRIKALLDSMDQAMMHNAPVSPQMLSEAKELFAE